MKKLIILLFLFVEVITYSQEKKIIGIPVEGVISIKRELPVSSKTNTESVKANSITPITPSNPTGGSQEVGITDGQLDVTLTGGATYTIPIKLPTGKNGVVPQVSLIYNSQAGNGIAGYGWNIAAGSVITRIPSTKYHDGVIDPVDFDDLDRYALDGQRLIVKSGTTGVYGANGTVYETENNSNIKITSFERFDITGFPYGPKYFIVEYPDGSKAKYGGSYNDTSDMDWGIVSWENKLGIKIKYWYQRSEAKLRLDGIVYNFINYDDVLSTSQSGIYFVYEDRKRAEYSGTHSSERKILKEIRVHNNTIGFRNYFLEHSVTSLGYERLTSITEKNGDNTKSYNPTIFSYEDSINSEPFTALPPVPINLTNTNSLNTESISGDFDGDGKTDLILYPTIGTAAKQKYWLYNDISNNNSNYAYEHNVGAFESIFPITLLIDGQSNNSKLLPEQGWNIVKTNATTNNTTFSSYIKYTVNPILLMDEKSFKFPKFTYGYYNECVTRIAPTDNLNRNIEPIDPGPVWIEVVKNIPKEYLSGDFNGDGISDIIVIEKAFTYSISSGCTSYTVTNNSGGTYFVNLDKRLTSNYVNPSGHIQIGLFSKFNVADVDGDGKSDLLVFDSGRVIVYTLNENNFLVESFRKVDSGILMDKPILFGDYNGDGKTDFAIPQIANLDMWSFFISTRFDFDKGTKPIGLNYLLPYYTTLYSSHSLVETSFVSSDFNGDGKSDIIFQQNITFERALINPLNGLPFGMPTGTQIGTPQATNFIFLENRSQNGNNINFNFSFTNFQPAGIKRFPIPVLTNHNQKNLNLEYSLISGGSIITFKHRKDSREDVLLRKITTGNGVSEYITYKPLKEEDIFNSDNIQFYRPTTLEENYPNMDIKLSPSFKVVSKLEKQSQSTYKKRLFGYYGAVTNVEGQGFLGFRSLLRTNWFNDNLPIISSVTKHDLSKNGAVKESYSCLNIAYNFENTPATFINKSVMINNSSLSTRKVLKIWNEKTTTYNGLEGTSSETSTSYDVYNNPIASTKLVKAGSTLIQTSNVMLDYTNQPIGSSYFIGRPKSKNASIKNEVDLDTTTSEEVYTYNTNNLLTKIQKKGHNTDFITEDNEYDLVGNVIKKTISANSITPRVSSYEYDTTGRYLLKSTDVEKLESTYTYDISRDLLIKEKNPYGLETKYDYDTWGKKIVTTDYLGKVLTTSYSRTETKNTTITSIGEAGSESISKFDDLGREIISGVKNIDNNWSYIKATYDDYDRKISVGQPVSNLSDNPTQFSKSFFDEYGRVIKTIDHTTKTTNVTYSGLTTIISDGSKTVTTTKNALGQPATVADEGGTINYTYYANGNLKKSNFGLTEISMKYDGWGRKTELVDPSAGTYLYEYNGLGETIKETTPNGVTEYKLNEVGKVTTKSITGNLTNTESNYKYDNTSKKLISSTFNDLIGQSDTEYTYTYDASQRIINVAEDNSSTARFEHTTTYDDFGRPSKETYKGLNYSNSKESTKTVVNTYKNGQHWQILDNGNNQVLWQTKTVNARGQLTTSKFGNGINSTNTYDEYGFPTQVKHNYFDDGIVIGGQAGEMVDVMILNTVFNPTKENLNKRYNSLFNTSESFEYDSLDRLTVWGADPQELFNTTFSINGNLEGFAPVNGATATISLGRLRINATLSQSGVQKRIVSNATLGTKLKIKVNVNKGGIDKIRIVIVEENPSSLQTNQYVLGLANEGIFEGNHTVLNNNWNVYIRFDKSQTSTDVGVLKTCYIDNLIVSKIAVANIQDYDLLGRITKNNLGNYNYTSSKQYRNTSIFTTTEADSYYSTRKLQTVTYNTFKSPIQITELGIEKIDFIYNDSNGRSAMYYGGLQEDKLERSMRKFYAADGSMEIKHNNSNGTTEFVTYIGGDGYTAPVILKSDGTTQHYFYLHRDYQGSIVAISNNSGQVVEKRLFDPWGNIIVIQDGSGNILSSLTVLDRGYTGHEHLQNVGLIHMNGRLYDPKLHRFLQPDNFIQNPYNTQNYNRYSYVLNNPLKYTDPSGENYNDGKPNEEGTGLSNTDQTLIGNAIASLANSWDELRIKEWANRNINIKSYGNWGTDNLKSLNGWVDKNLRSIGKFFGIGKSNKEVPNLPAGSASFASNYGSSSDFSATMSTGFQTAGGGSIEMHPYVFSNEALLFAGVASASDGPLPFGEAVGATYLSYEAMPIVYRAHLMAVNDMKEFGATTSETIRQSLSPDGFKYVTYTKTNTEGLVYVGRTSGYGTVDQIVRDRDSRHHIKGYGRAIPTSSIPATKPGGYRGRLLDSSYWAIRGSEQWQIEHYRQLGISGNVRNGIGISNNQLLKYLEWGKILLRF